MKQLSLIDNEIFRLAGAMAGIKTAMREVAGSEESEGRKLLVDRINKVARQAGIKLTGGNTIAITKATLDKWLAPGDASHPPSILAVLAFVAATNNPAPLKALMNAAGLDIMTAEDRRYRDLGKLEVEMKAARKRKKILEAGL